ncbi:hypothetical protein BH10BAC2_BH10BAC2_18980 [soil metagenome]
MHKPIKPGRNIFAIGIIALGILCIISKDFIVGRPPALSWAAEIPGKLVWAYISGFLFVIAGLAILFNKKAGLASLIIGIMILVFSFILRHLYEMSDWLNAYKSLALSGGAFIVAASFFKKKTGNFRISLVNHDLIFAGTLFLSLFFIGGGIAHFKFADFVINFIPAYIPFHAFWTYFCGFCLLAGGIGLFIPQIRRWAAFLSGIMVAGWFILLHIPRFVANTSDAGDRMGLCESFTFVGIFFVLAGMFSQKE